MGGTMSCRIECTRIHFADGREKELDRDEVVYYWNLVKVKHFNTLACIQISVEGKIYQQTDMTCIDILRHSCT